MEKHTIIMGYQMINIDRYKRIISTLLIFMLPTFIFSQELNPDEGNDIIEIAESELDFLPIDSVLVKVWKINTVNQNCKPLIVGNLIFPSVVKRIVVDAITGTTYNFGSEKAISLFKTENLDSIICMPACDSVALVNIYTNRIVFTAKRYLHPGDDPLYFPKDGILYYSTNSKLIAYNYLNDKIIWETKIENYTNNLYINYENYVILNDEKNLLIINKKNGEILRKYKSKYYNSNTIINNFLYYIGINEIVKVDLNSFVSDTLVRDYSLDKKFSINDDTLYYSIRGKLFNYILSQKTSKQLSNECVSSNNFVKINNFIFASQRLEPYHNFSTIYNIEKGGSVYKYFAYGKTKNHFKFNCKLYSFVDKLTENGLLIGYTLEGEIQAFKFKK